MFTNSEFCIWILLEIRRSFNTKIEQVKMRNQETSKSPTCLAPATPLPSRYTPHFFSWFCWKSPVSRTTEINWRNAQKWNAWVSVNACLIRMSLLTVEHWQKTQTWKPKDPPQDTANRTVQCLPPCRAERRRKSSIMAEVSRSTLAPPLTLPPPPRLRRRPTI